MKNLKYVFYGFLFVFMVSYGIAAFASHNVNVSGALEQITADNITVKPKDSPSVIVNVNKKTKYIDKFGKVLSASLFSAGDEISIKGEKKKISKDETVIIANEARDISPFKSSAEKLGKVKQITGENEFILKMLNKPETEYAVRVIQGTKIRQNEKDAPFSALVPGGQKIHLSGVLNEKNQVITASKIIINSEDREDKKDDKKVKKNITLQGALQQAAQDSITIKTGDGLSAVILINSDTRFERKFGGKTDISEFAIGDELKIKGIRNSENPEIITAKNVKDASVFKIKGTKDGIVQGISGNIVILKTRNGEKYEDYSVKVTEETKIKNNGKKIDLADIYAGQKITVSGIMNINVKTIAAKKITVSKSEINRALLDGTVESIDGQNSKFVFIYSGGKSAVKVTAGTKIVSGSELKTFGDLKAGNEIKVDGVRDNEDNKLIIAEEIRIFK